MALYAKFKQTILPIAVVWVVALTILGLGIGTVTVQCQPQLASGIAPVATKVLMQCNYHSSRLWGLWPQQKGQASDVQSVVTAEHRTPKGATQKALALSILNVAEPSNYSVVVSSYGSPGFSAEVLLGLNKQLADGQPFTQGALVFDQGLIIFGIPYLLLGCLALLFWHSPAVSAAPSAARPTDPTAPTGPFWPAVWQGWQRTGRAGCSAIFGLSGLMTWIVLAVLFITLCLAATWVFQVWMPHMVNSNIVGTVAAMLGSVDFFNRMRTTQYIVPTALGLEVTRPALVIDRLTFCECGWYTPFFNASFPIWLVGGAILLGSYSA